MKKIIKEYSQQDLEKDITNSGSSIKGSEMTNGGNLNPDFIKIDTEGFEYYILLGGEKTIKEHKPTIIVEQKPNKGKTFGLKDTQAVDLLKSWGYSLHGQIAGDYVLSCS